MLDIKDISYNTSWGMYYIEVWGLYWGMRYSEICIAYNTSWGTYYIEAWGLYWSMR